MKNLDNWIFIKDDGRWFIEYKPWYWPFGAIVRSSSDDLKWFRSRQRAFRYEYTYGFRSRSQAENWLKNYLRGETGNNIVKASEVLFLKEDKKDHDRKFVK